MLQEIYDRKVWNGFLLAQPTQVGVFLQSWEWGEFQAVVGRKVWRLGVMDQVSGASFAQAIELPLPLGKKYWFIPRGTVIDGLKEEAQKHGALFVRCEPMGSKPPPNAVHTKSISPTQTLLIDLTQSEDELLSAMHEKTRYNIRLAQRKGVKCGIGDKGGKGFGEFWKLLKETAKRDGFRTHERGYYETMLRVLSNPSQPPLTLRGGDQLGPPLKVRGGEGGVMHVRFHATYHGSVMLAGAIVAYFGDTATYLHGASSYEHRALMGPYALHWEIMQDAKAQGYQYYDFWGVSSPQSPSPLMGEGGGEGGRSSWLGITRFKLGFGGQVINYPGTFDLPINRLWYAVYRLGRFCKI